MFGKRQKLEKRVERGEGRRAYATILHTTKFLPGQGLDVGGNGQIGGTYRVKVRVEPDAEPAFEAHVTMHVTSLSLQPREGERIPVLYSGEKVAWDEPVAKEDFGRKAAAKLHLSDEEKDRFRNTLLRKLDELHGTGKMSDAEYRARKAEIEADPQLNP